MLFKIKYAGIHINTAKIKYAHKGEIISPNGKATKLGITIHKMLARANARMLKNCLTAPLIAPSTQNRRIRVYIIKSILLIAWLNIVI